MVLTIFVTIEAGCDWRLRVVLFGCEDVAEEGVVDVDEGEVEGCLGRLGSTRRGWEPLSRGGWLIGLWCSMVSVQETLALNDVVQLIFASQ